MQTAPSPQLQPQPASPKPRRRGYLWLALTALVASVFGLGVGSALRFQMVPAVTTTNTLDPEQAFPPLANWPPKAPRARRLNRDFIPAPERRLLPAAEAATALPDTLPEEISDAGEESALLDLTSEQTASQNPSLSEFDTDPALQPDSSTLGAFGSETSSGYPASNTAEPSSTQTPTPSLNEPEAEVFPITPAAPSPQSNNGNSSPTLNLPDKSSPALPAAPAPAIEAPIPEAFEDE